MRVLGRPAALPYEVPDLTNHQLRPTRTTHEEARIHRFCLEKSPFPLVTPQLRTMEIILPDCRGFLPIPNTNCRGSRQSVTIRRAAVFFLPPGGYEHKTSQKTTREITPHLDKTTRHVQLMHSGLRQRPAQN